MKIVVDYDRCESNGLCMGILPEVFEVRDDDFMYVLDEHPPEEYRAKVMQAVNACPTQAISVVEDDEADAAAPASEARDTAPKPAKAASEDGDDEVEPPAAGA